MNKKIRIVFLYRGLDFWLNNHSFYKECLWDGNFDIWVVPESNYIDPETLSMLKNDKVKIIEKNIKEGQYFDLKRLNPDYVLIATPYKAQRNKIYNAEYLQKFTKVLYIPYGVVMHSNYKKEYFLNEDFPNVYKIFLDTKEDFDTYSNFLSKKNLVLSSHPIFDLFQNYCINKYTKCWLNNQNINDKNNSRKTILWTPHWTFKKWWLIEDYKDTVGNSDFVKYADLWLKIPKLYPNINFIMRPHPNLFRELPRETDGLWTEEKVKDWKKEFESNQNAKIDGNTNYIIQFLISDAVINSSLSFTTVLINTRKSILSVRDIENSPELNKRGKNIENSYYKAKNENDIINFIENVVVGEKDNMLKEREKVLKDNIFIPKGGSGLFIKNYLKNDYEENSNKKINLKEIFRNKYNI